MLLLESLNKLTKVRKVTFPTFGKLGKNLLGSRKVARDGFEKLETVKTSCRKVKTCYFRIVWKVRKCWKTVHGDMCSPPVY